jgi:hypothetical protein
MEPDPDEEPPKKKHRACIWSDAQREKKGFGSMLDFFKPPQKPGRPAGLPDRKSVV